MIDAVVNKRIFVKGGEEVHHFSKYDGFRVFGGSHLQHNLKDHAQLLTDMGAQDILTEISDFRDIIAHYNTMDKPRRAQK